MKNKLKLDRSRKLFELAQKHLVGGVNSPVRAFKGVGELLSSSPGARGPI